MVLVSVLMGSYNHEKYLAEAIESVLNQTFKDFELIVVDDSSKDSSQKIIEQYKIKDPRIRAFYHEKNMGIAKSANQALAEANGKFIAFIGSDDVWVPFKLEKQLKLIKYNEDKILWSEAEIIDAAGSATGQTFTQLNSASEKKKTGNLFKEIVDDNYIVGQSLLIKKDNLNGITFDASMKYLNDYRFMLDLASQHEFLFISEPLVKYRIHGANLIAKDYSGWLKDRILLRKYILERYGHNISRNYKGILCLKIGIAYSNLGHKDLAKQFYKKAISIDFLSKEIMLYLIYELTDAKGLIGKMLLSFYYKMNSALQVQALKSS